MSFVDILRIIAILGFGVLCGWVIYQMMQSADANKENEDDEEQDSEENDEKE